MNKGDYVSRREAERPRSAQGLSRVVLAVASAMMLAGCGAGAGSGAQTGQVASTAYPSFSPLLGTCKDWLALTPEQRRESLPWVYATMIQSEEDIPTDGKRRTYRLRLTPQDVTWGVTRIDKRCKAQPSYGFTSVALYDFPWKLPRGITKVSGPPLPPSPANLPSASSMPMLRPSVSTSQSTEPCVEVVYGQTQATVSTC